MYYNLQRRTRPQPSDLPESTRCQPLQNPLHRHALAPHSDAPQASREGMEDNHSWLRAAANWITLGRDMCQTMPIYARLRWAQAGRPCNAATTESEHAPRVSTGDSTSEQAEMKPTRATSRGRKQNWNRIATEIELACEPRKMRQTRAERQGQCMSCQTRNLRSRRKERRDLVETARRERQGLCLASAPGPHRKTNN